MKRLASLNRDRRTFTIMELMLASVLGALILITCLGIFAALNRTDRRQEVRLSEAMEFALAQRAITTALGSLVMPENTPADPEIRKREEDQAIREAETDWEHTVDDDADMARFSIGRDPQQGGNLEYDGRLVFPQVVQLSLITSPVFAPPNEKAELEELGSGAGRSSAQEQKRLADERKRRRQEREHMTASERSALRKQAAGAVDKAALTGGTNGAPIDLSTMSLDQLEDPPIAPGVRGAFELLPDEPEGKTRRSPTEADGSLGQGWSLWWRELPARASLGTELLGGRTDTAGRRDTDLAALATLSDSGEKRVKLLSGLKSCYWEVYKLEKHYSKITAMYDVELPAYVVLHLQTLRGREEHWMFEVGWSRGPEPGSVVSNPTNDLTTPLDAIKNLGDPTNNAGGNGNNLNTPPPNPNPGTPLNPGPKPK